MSKFSFFLLFVFFTVSDIYAQSSNGGIVFQALARDVFQNPALNKNVIIQSNIIQSSKTGLIVLSEEHTVTTDPIGVFTINVGLGNRIGGTKLNLFDIDWSNGPYYLNIKIAIPSTISLSSTRDWIDLGTTNFGVVPYALHILDNNKSISLDTSSLNLKLNIIDTSAMLSKRIARDTFSLSRRIIDKLNIADSINGYVTKYQLLSKTIDLSPIYDKLNAKLFVNDTVSLSNRINLKVNSSDLTSDLLLKANVVDITIGLANKVDKITGKILSTNDYTTEEKFKLASISGVNTGDQDLSSFATITNLALKANASDITTSLDLKANRSDLISGLVIKANTNDVNAGLGLKANTIDVSASLLTKANVIDMIIGLSNKVDKVTGKDLSTNDYSTVEKSKLAAIIGVNTGDQDLSNYVTTSDILFKESLVNKSNDINLGGTSSNNVLYPSQKAVKTYVDGQISAGGISDGSILARHIANGNITTTLIADASITDAKIAMGINKAKVGLGNVENFAISTWTGSSQIANLGTVSTGVWNGTTISIANGGTGANNAINARDNLGLAIGRDVQALLTSTQAGVLSNTTGINTGDETISSIKTKLGITTLSGVNTGDQDLSSYATTTNLSFKANASDVTSSLLLKANTSDVTTSLATKANSSDLTSGLLLKANTSDVTTSLATKANSSDLTSGLLLKANASDVTSSLATKVDKVTGKDLSTNDYTTTEKTKLSSISGTNTGDQDLSSYATTTNLALKANTSDVTSSLLLKANASDVTTSLALKANLISPTLVMPTLGVATATSISSGTITSTSDIIAKRYKLTMPAAITATANTTIDLSTGNMFTINLGITPSNFDVSNAGVGTYLIKFVQDATGSRDVIFPTAWKWSGGIAPNLTNTAGKLDIVTLIYDGSTYYATIVSNF